MKRVNDNIMKELDLIAKYIGEIQQNKNVNSNLRGVERTLERIFELNITLQIVDNDSREFFGMTVTPTYMDRIIMAMLGTNSTKDILYEAWRKEDSWTIEIDDTLLYDKNLNANPHEIVAVLLHEMGHVIYSNEAVSRANRVIKLALMKTTTKYKKIFEVPKFQHLFKLSIYESCSTKRFRFPSKDDREECAADDFVKIYGHENELITFIEKLLKSKGNGLIDRTNAEMDNDVRILANWSIENVASLEYRKDRLKRALKTERQRNKSTVVIKLTNEIYDKIFGSREDEKTDFVKSVIQEQYLYEEIDKIIRENTNVKIKPKKSFGMDITKAKKINVAELDILDVDIERIEYPDDKVYILERIYTLLEKVDNMILLIDNGYSTKVAQSKNTLMNLRERLLSMRVRVLNLKLTEKEYGLFIKYPKGYEG